MRSSSGLSGRSSPLPRRRTDASELTATTSDAPSAARLLEVGDVPAMQDVEHAVGEHERARQRGDARQRVARVERSSPGSAARAIVSPALMRQFVYSNSLTTRTTPDVVAAICAAASPSWRETMPIR